MRTLYKRLNDYKKATNGEPDRLLAIEAMEKIITVAEEHLALARSRCTAVSMMKGFLHDANDILAEGAESLRSDLYRYEHELEKHYRLVGEIRAFVSLPPPAQALLMQLLEKLECGTDTDMQEKEN